MRVGGCRARRGSALILVLVMTLAVAGLAIAAIFMSSSAGLLSRFYDREREHRYTAESALALVQSRLRMDPSFAVPDTGMMQVLAGFQVLDASGGAASNVAVNVFAAATGDTTGLGLPHVTLIAAAYDARGTRHVRRVDLRRESFSRFGLFVDSFPSTTTFGPGTVQGRVHSNDAWRSGTSSATAGAYLDTISAVGGFTGTATYASDSTSLEPRIQYPRDSTFAGLTTLAAAGNLSWAPVSGSGFGWRQGSRLEFVAFDADGDASVEEGEGFARVFDLAAGMDTSRLRVTLNQAGFFTRVRWNDPVVQNQCGAFYYRGNRWHFFPVSTHRAEWAGDIIQATGSPNYPSVTNPTMNAMDDYNHGAVAAILDQPTARCFPAGSPYLLTTERMTNAAGVVTGTAADTVPFGVIAPPGGWPVDAPNGYGGNDTTFSALSLTCVFYEDDDDRCNSGTRDTVGSWRAFAGTAVSGIATSIRQAEELPYLWPLSAASNAGSRGVMRVTSGPVMLSGTLRGALTLVVDGAAIIIESLRYQGDPADPGTETCADRLGLVAVGDVLFADNALMRARRIYNNFWTSSFVEQLGPARDLTLHGSFMSLTGTVGPENPGLEPAAFTTCPKVIGNQTAAGCLYLTGGLVMQRYSSLWSGNNTGLRWAGTPDRCQSTDRRPPFFPLTNRYTQVRTLEIEPSQANNPTKIRALLMRLKGKTL